MILLLVWKKQEFKFKVEDNKTGYFEVDFTIQDYGSIDFNKHGLIYRILSGVWFQNENPKNKTSEISDIPAYEWYPVAQEIWSYY